MVEPVKVALERFTCFTCREPVGHEDLVSVKEKIGWKLIETFHCTSCGKKILGETTFEEAVEKQLVLKWVGKTWAFETSLYVKEVWEDLQRGLKEGIIFPEDSLISQYTG